VSIDDKTLVFPVVASGAREDHNVRFGNFHTLKPLCDGENFRLAVGYEHRVFS
jgi:hypothetical protein